MASFIKDNYKKGTVGNYLKDTIKKDAELSFVSAYFTIYAFERLQKELENAKQLRFLFGEPKFVKSMDKQREFQAYKVQDEDIKIDNLLQQKKVAKDCSDWIEEKVEIRSVKRSNFLHGKAYLIDNKISKDAIIGSSNFTVRGLGMSERENDNIELNLVVDSNSQVKELYEWFDAIWENENFVEDVKEKVLDYLKQIYKNQIPEFIYYKTLFHLFEKYLIDEDTHELLKKEIGFYNTKAWEYVSKYEFQKNGVTGAINKILTNNGCIIADSVGLGKTFEALAVIKFFNLRKQRVLVLCPKKLENNWALYKNNDTRNPLVKDDIKFDLMAHTDLSRETGKTSSNIELSTVNWNNYDLVVIDESHNFRNNKKGKNNKLSRYEKLMQDIIQKGMKTKVLLLSATPVNNNLTDLYNQIALITAGDDTCFDKKFNIPNYKNVFVATQKEFDNWLKNKHHRTKKDLFNSLKPEFFKLLDELTIARSRKHIEKFYKSDFKALGGFSIRQPVVSIYPELDTLKSSWSYHKINTEIEHYKLSLFRPSEYVLDDYKELYGISETKINKKTKKEQEQYNDQKTREHYLIGMMKMNFLKRLESSVQSFYTTMQRTILKVDELVEKLEKFDAFKKENPDFDFENLFADFDDDDNFENDVLKEFQVGKKLIYKLEHIDIEQWKTDLLLDKDQLIGLKDFAEKIIDNKRDAKLLEVKKLIQQKINKPSQNKEGKPNRKILIFSAFSDTAEYLYNELKEFVWKKNKINIALVTGSKENKTTFGKNRFEDILINFSPLSKGRNLIKDIEKNEEIDILIATDCISEGQNLQDCDYMINYDIHWNPVRVIQRFGRIDRIGSKNEFIQMVNFWPTKDLDGYMKLKQRVESRMALVDMVATQQDNVLDSENFEDLLQEDAKFRVTQLKKLQTEVLDLEDLDTGVTLNDFTLDDFREDLKNFLLKNKEELRNAPMGMFAVVPTNPDFPIIEPGVIFCLKQKDLNVSNLKQNQLHPYFLVYVLDSGHVKFGYTQVKTLLEIYKVTCSDKKEPYEELCKIFDQQTDYGRDIDNYSGLFKSAVKSITSDFSDISKKMLTSGRGTVLTDKNKQITDKSEFELITWLIIK